MEKQAFALIKALKDFRVYILHSHTVSFVHSIEVKDILTQIDPEGRRAKWIAILLEYDLDIKHTKLIRGQELAKLMTHPSIDFLEINLLDTSTGPDIQNNENKFYLDYLASPWYADIIYVLKNIQAHPELSKSKARSIKLKSTKYCSLDGYLYWKDTRGILLNCLLETEVRENIDEFHKKDCGGHLFWKTTAYKIVREGFYWSTLFSNVYKGV